MVGRIGGDEFCVIAENAKESKIKEAYQEMNTLIEQYNKEYPQMNMSVAYGYATYDPSKDEDIKDTRGRADKNMYRNKMEMKQEIQ